MMNLLTWVVAPLAALTLITLAYAAERVLGK